jgi:GTP cyclohydrolase III
LVGRLVAATHIMDIGCENKGKSNQKQLKRAKTYWKTIQISLYGNEFMMKKSWNLGCFSFFVGGDSAQVPLCKVAMMDSMVC